jgi:hypothetical protein
MLIKNLRIGHHCFAGTHSRHISLIHVKYFMASVSGQICIRYDVSDFFEDLSRKSKFG